MTFLLKGTNAKIQKALVMNLFYIVCSVSGVTLLACAATLSALGLGSGCLFSEEETEEVGQEIESTSASGLRPLVSDTARPAESAQELIKTGLNRVRSLGVAIVFFGLTGWFGDAGQFTTIQTAALSLLVGVVAYFAAGFLTWIQLDETVRHQEIGCEGDAPHAADPIRGLSSRV